MDAWDLGGSNVFLLVLILLATSLVLLRSTYLGSLARRHYIITPNFWYIIITRLTAWVLPLGALPSFSPSLCNQQIDADKQTPSVSKLTDPQIQANQKNKQTLPRDNSQ